MSLNKFTLISSECMPLETFIVKFNNFSVLFMHIFIMNYTAGKNISVSNLRMLMSDMAERL